MHPECQTCRASLEFVVDEWRCPHGHPQTLILDQPRPKREDVEQDGLNL